MNRLFLPAMTCFCALSFATSAVAVVKPSHHDTKDNRDCTNCGIIYNINDDTKDFEPDDAKNAAETIGYKVLTEPEKQKDLYIMLVEKGGFYSELHVTSDKKVYVQRMVDKDDPQWGAKIQR